MQHCNIILTATAELPSAFPDFFDVAHTLVAMVPTKEGTLFFYVNRFWVDYWNGLVPVRRAVGKQVMAGRMKKRLKKLGICK